jgi:hypothetical protein
MDPEIIFAVALTISVPIIWYRLKKRGNDVNPTTFIFELATIIIAIIVLIAVFYQPLMSEISKNSLFLAVVSFSSLLHGISSIVRLFDSKQEKKYR